MFYAFTFVLCNKDLLTYCVHKLPARTIDISQSRFDSIHHCTSRILTCTELKGQCFVCFSLWLRVLD